MFHKNDPLPSTSKLVPKVFPFFVKKKKKKKFNIIISILIMVYKIQFFVEL